MSTCSGYPRLTIPGHNGILGNEIADKLAKEAVNLPVNHNFHKPASLIISYNRAAALKQWKSQWETAENGGFLRRLDTSLPYKHARRLYDSQKRARTNILAQLRTGHSWLASHAKRIKNREDDKCECGARETVHHVLMDCPKLRAAREKLRKRIGDEDSNSLSLTLGGKPQKTSSGTTEMEDH